ncbi:MAG: carboxylesterase [Burkholderiaceae bacterium]|nr:carboxylesterase [Burkholderiaceae bacterium]
MSLETLEIETGASPRASIVLMHGLGADCHDFEPLAEQLDLRAAGPVRYVFPNAPQIPVTINGGFVMPAWYDIRAADLANREDEGGLRASQAEIERLIAHEVARGVPASRIVLAGFSQGAAMALMTGLRHAERLAGIVGMSGYLPLADRTASERHAANQSTPIWLAHGRQDDVVPIGRAMASRDALAALGYSVSWSDYAMGHSVCPEELVALNRWLLTVLAPA